jgi:hypothetical protein
MTLMTMGMYSASGANGKNKKKATLERIHREAIELGTRSAGCKISASEVFQYIEHQCTRFLAFTIAISLIDQSIVLRHMMKPLAHHLCSVALRLTVLNHSLHFRTAALG